MDVEISQKNDEADNAVEQEEKFDSDHSSDTGTASAWTNDTGDEGTDPEANDREKSGANQAHVTLRLSVSLPI